MIRIRPIAQVVGLQLCGLSVAAFITGAVELLAEAEPDWRAFWIVAGITGYCGLSTFLATGSGRPFELNVRQAFLVTAATWVFLPLAAAGPFLLSGMSVTDAVFEAVSGITTTGSTVITGLDGLPHGLLFWRAMLQWVGGVGIIVMAIVLLPFLRVGGMQLFQTESSERSEKIVPSAFHLVSWIVAVYSGLTFVCAAVYAAQGMSIFDAICHAMTTLATGGYSTHDASFGYYTNTAIQWTGALFMLAGALPFVVYIRMIKGDAPAIGRDPQVRGLVALLILVIASLTVWTLIYGKNDPLAAVRTVTFNVISVVTTTGFASEDYGAWGTGAAGTFFMLMFIGGCAGSTSGAIKIYRFQILGIVIRSQLLRLTSPNRVVLMKYEGKRLPDDLPLSVLAFLAVFLGTVALFSVLLTVMGLDLVTALSASVTAISNVGPGLGPQIGPAGNFAGLPDAAKWLLSAAMLLGRLEIFALLLIFDPETWRG